MNLDEIYQLLMQGPTSQKRIKQALQLAFAQGQLERLDKEIASGQRVLEVLKGERHAAG